MSADRPLNVGIFRDTLTALLSVKLSLMGLVVLNLALLDHTTFSDLDFTLFQGHSAAKRFYFSRCALWFQFPKVTLVEFF